MTGAKDGVTRNEGHSAALLNLKKKTRGEADWGFGLTIRVFQTALSS